MPASRNLRVKLTVPFGLISAIVSREAFGRYKVQVPGSASRIAIDRMQQAMQARPKLRRLILGYSEALLAQTFQTVSCNAIHTVEARCCNWILSTRDRIDEDVLPLTHADLAEMLGVQRSTVSTTLRTLQMQSLITQQRGASSLRIGPVSRRSPANVMARSDRPSHACCPCRHPRPDHKRSVHQSFLGSRRTGVQQREQDLHWPLNHDHC
jgi:Crp-like helix-turn-helix protein